MAILTGGLIALLHALLSVTYRVDQIISGVVINLLALGLTGFLRSEVIVDTGISTGVPTGAIGLPLLSEIPIVGPQLFTNKPIFFAMLVIVAVTNYVLLPHSVRAAGAVGRRAPPRGRDPGRRPDPRPLSSGGDRRAHRRARSARGSRSSRRPGSRTT